MPYIAPVPITHSSVTGNVPDTAGELATGALAVNVADGALYTKDYAGAIVRIEGDGGNATLASAATLDLGAVMAGVVDVTGTTTITAITLRVGQTRTVRFTGVLTLTHGASLVLPGGASITTAAGDFATFRGYAGGVVRCIAYSFSSTANFSKLTITKSLRLTGVTDNHFVHDGTGFVWTDTGLPDGTMRAGIYGSAADKLVLFGGASITPVVSVSATGAEVVGALTATGAIKTTQTRGFVTSTGNPGYTGTVTTASLTGKTIYFEDGLIVGFQ